MRSPLHQDERIDWFIEDDVIREDGALCAFHYFFDRYRKWRVSYGLLATEHTETSFAHAIASTGIAVDFDRQLFMGIHAKGETPAWDLKLPDA
jgi:hypothetical protein